MFVLDHVSVSGWKETKPQPKVDENHCLLSIGYNSYVDSKCLAQLHSFHAGNFQELLEIIFSPLHLE